MLRARRAAGARSRVATARRRLIPCAATLGSVRSVHVWRAIEARIRGVCEGLAGSRMRQSVLVVIASTPCVRAADVFHANVFMAQCGGIGVGELNKLELDLCERLSWKLLPTAHELRELLDALSNPHAPFWAPWFNARAAVGTSGTLLVDPSGPSPSRLPPSRSVAHSLGRMFRVGSRINIHSSDGNLPALEKDVALAALQQQQQQQGEVPQVPQQHSGLPPAPPGDGWAAMAGKAAAGDYSGDDGSPRTVIQRTFSLSNLFGLSW